MEKQPTMKELIEKVEKLKATGELDLSMEEDLSIAVMNLISLEEHFYFTAERTGNNEYFDLIYIDGDHTYDVVKQDLNISYQKLKQGGWLWINDYTTHDPHHNVSYGVQKATNELINQYQTPVIYFALNNSNFHDICLQKP